MSQVFYDIASKTGNHSLNPDEVKLFLDILHVHMSGNEMARLYVKMGNSTRISFGQFYEFYKEIVYAPPPAGDEVPKHKSPALLY